MAADAKRLVLRQVQTKMKSKLAPARHRIPVKSPTRPGYRGRLLFEHAMNKQSAANLPGPGPGRPKGSPNKTTALLKDAILKAATDAGQGDLSAYLQAQALANPGPFMALLGKVLPMQVTGEDGAIGITFKTVYEQRRD